MRIEGEWWVVDGDVHVADGEGDNANHEFYVWWTLVHEFAEAIEEFDILRDIHSLVRPWAECPEQAGDPIWLRTFMCDHFDMLLKEGRCDEEAYDDTYGFIRDLIEWDEKRMNLLTDPFDADARQWAIRERNWIRLAAHETGSHQVTMRELQRYSLGSLRAGLDWVADEQMVDIEKATFDLETLKPDRVYRNVPYSVLLAEQPREVRRFDNFENLPRQAALEANQ